MPGRVYALSSGMMTPKTLSNIFARRVIENPQALDFLCRLRRSGIARRNSARPRSRATWFRSIRTSRRSRCVATSSNFNSARTRRANRSSHYVKKLAPKKIVLVHGDVPAVEWMRAQLVAELPGSEVIVPTPGVEMEL